jgi:chromosome segregation ATPase
MEKIDPSMAKEIMSLKSAITDFKMENTQALSEIVKENETLRSELLNTNNIKEEIVNDFTKIKEAMSGRDMALDQKEEEIQKLKEEIILTRDHVKTLQAEAAATESDENKLTEEIYNSLRDICQKYEELEYINKQMKSKQIMVNYNENKVFCSKETSNTRNSRAAQRYLKRSKL